MLERENNLFFRVVSMPCLNIFKNMSKSYQQEVLGDTTIFVMEAGSSCGLEGISTSTKTLLTIDTFGRSGKKQDVMKALAFTEEQLKRRILDVYGVKHEK